MMYVKKDNINGQTSEKTSNECNVHGSFSASEKTSMKRHVKVNEKISYLFCKLEAANYEAMDDSTLEEIYFHLNVVENLMNLSKMNSEVETSFITKTDSNERIIEPLFNEKEESR